MSIQSETACHPCSEIICAHQRAMFFIANLQIKLALLSGNQPFRVFRGPKLHLNKKVQAPPGHLHLITFYQ
jgi:hypothetical protein